jgi:hypothetical protein
MFGRRMVPRRELPRARRAVTVGLLRTRAWAWGEDEERAPLANSFGFDLEVMYPFTVSLLFPVPVPVLFGLPFRLPFTSFARFRGFGEVLFELTKVGAVRR